MFKSISCPFPRKYSRALITTSQAHQLVVFMRVEFKIHVQRDLRSESIYNRMETDLESFGSSSEQNLFSSQ